ncbi:hypothetical protein D3C77_748270 [compost metagenome]
MMAAWMPLRLAGLCSGASWMLASMLARVSSVSRVDAKNFSPPCTTRWPMPSR